MKTLILLCLLLTGCACPAPMLMTAGHVALDADPAVIFVDAAAELFMCMEEWK